MKITKTYIVALGPGTKFRVCYEAETDEEFRYYLKSTGDNLIEISSERFQEILDNVKLEKEEENFAERWVY